MKIGKWEIKRSLGISPIENVETIIAPPDVKSLGAADTEPYLWDYPFQFVAQMQAKKKPGEQLSADQMRTLARDCTTLRSVINYLKNQVSIVPLDIVPKFKQPSTGINEARYFFDIFGGLAGYGNRRSQLEERMLEDVLVVGYTAIYLKRDNNKVVEAKALDAGTFRIRCNSKGQYDDPPYEQVINGEKRTLYNYNQIIYNGPFANSYRPDFMSPVSWVQMPADSLIKLREWNYYFLAWGSTPNKAITIPTKSGSIQEIEAFMEKIREMLSGSPEQRQRIIPFPEGTQILDLGKTDMDFKEYEKALVREICAVYGVHPACIGMSGDTAYKESMEELIQSTARTGVGPLLEFRKSIYDRLLVELGYPNLEVVNLTDEEGQAITDTKEEEDLKDDLNNNPKEEEDTERILLKKWESKAITRLKEKGNADCDFEGLNSTVTRMIKSRLSQCKTKEDIKEIFTF